MKKKHLFCIAILICISSYSQTTIAEQGFDGTTNDTWSYAITPAAYNTSGDVWASVNSLGTIASPDSGSDFWGMQDLDNSNGGGAFNHTIEFSNISVSGETNILLTFSYYTDGYDTTDELSVEYFFDDISQGVESLQKNTDAWTTYGKVIPDGTTNVKFTLIGFQNGGSDYAGFDSILLQSGANTNPSISISSPTQGGTVTINSSGADVDGIFDIINFTLSGDDGNGASDNSGDGFIQYSIDSGSLVNLFDTVISLDALPEGNHTLFAQLVDNGGNPLSVDDSINFNVLNMVQTLPLYEPFDYTVGETLGTDQINWVNAFTGDEIIIGSGNLSYPDLQSSTGNHVMFDGAGMDPVIEFNEVTSGIVYASFIFSVADQSAITDLTDGGYFAFLGTFDARLWVRPTSSGSSTFDIGGLYTPFNPPVYSGPYNVGDNIFVVMSFDIDNDIANAWINPSSAELQATTAPATITLTETSTDDITSINSFSLRQDSTGETPFILFDELRIGTSWDDVTPNTLSNEEFSSNRFSIYPNPTTDGFVNITSTDSNTINAKVFDILGKQVKNETLTNNRLNVSNLKSGIYILKISQNDASVTKKLVIK